MWLLFLQEVHADKANLNEYQQRLVHYYLHEARMNGITIRGEERKKFLETLHQLVEDKKFFQWVCFVSSLCQYFCDAVYFLVSDKLTVLVNSRYLSLSISLERVTSRRHASLSIACCLVIARPKLSGCRSSLTNNRSQPALPWSSSSSSPVLGRTPNAGHSRYV